MSCVTPCSCTPYNKPATIHTHHPHTCIIITLFCSDDVFQSNPLAKSICITALFVQIIVFPCVIKPRWKAARSGGEPGVTASKLRIPGGAAASMSVNTCVSLRSGRLPAAEAANRGSETSRHGDRSSKLFWETPPCLGSLEARVW